jgi:hypothetical protein
MKVGETPEMRAWDGTKAYIGERLVKQIYEDRETP